MSSIKKLKRYGDGALRGMWGELIHGYYHEQLGYGSYTCRLCNQRAKLRAEIAGVCQLCGRPNIDEARAGQKEE